MKPHVEQCQNIKSLLERLSGVPNIGAKSRKRNYCDLKKTYYKLCEEFTLASLEVMSATLGGYSHGSAIHGIREFKILQEIESLTCLDVYSEAKRILKEEYKIKIQIIQNLEHKEILKEIKYHETRIQELINKIEIN